MMYEQPVVGYRPRPRSKLVASLRQPLGSPVGLPPVSAAGTAAAPSEQAGAYDQAPGLIRQPQPVMPALSPLMPGQVGGLRAGLARRRPRFGGTGSYRRPTF